MYPTLSSIQFHHDEPFTAEEHLLDKDNIIVRDGDTVLALKRTKTLAQLMKNVDHFPVIDETLDIGYQVTMTLFYRTNADRELKQITFPYDPSVFNNYSIFHFIQTGEFPHQDGTVYRLGDLRCFTVGSWIASSCTKTLFMGEVPMFAEPVGEPVGEAPVVGELPVQIPISEPVHYNLSPRVLQEVNWESSWPSNGETINE
jgi:hypothetical protein